jgi:hypothetical protein
MINSLRKSVYFIADGAADVTLQSDIIKSISQLYNVILIWNANSICNSKCHPIKNIEKNPTQKILDLGHVDSGSFKEILDLTSGVGSNSVVISINEILNEFENFPLILINLPTINSAPLLINAQTIKEMNSISERFKRVLVLCNAEDALYSVEEFAKVFDLYQIINLEFDQIEDRVVIFKSEISKLIDLIGIIH